MQKDNAGQHYFTDFVAQSYEHPIIAMLNTIQANFIRDGAEGPTLVGSMTGSSGKPLLSLYMSSDNRQTDVAIGMANTLGGQFFYTHDATTNTYDSYLNSNGTAVLVRNSTYEPNLFDRVIESLKSIKAAADAGGFEVTDDLVFSLIQGQADSSGYPGISYAQQVEMLVAKLNLAADAILHKDINVISVIGQTRYNYPSDQQLKYVETTGSSFLGALEFPYQAEFPATLDWRDGSVLGKGVTHLNEIGYNLLGQETGNIIYGALSKKLREGDYLRIDSLSVEDNTVVVRVAGLRGHLVSDTSIFATEVGTFPPDNLGFSLLKGAQLSILNAVVSGADEVTLTLSGAVSGSLTLSVGNNVGFGGTPLRDSIMSQAWNPFNVAPLADIGIRKFLPTQTLVFDAEGLISGTLEAVSSGSSRRTLFGTAGDDLILGTSASDRLIGGAGNDTLVGGGGHDLLLGGRGADRFVLSWSRLADTIVDFAPDEGDVIDLGMVFASKLEVGTAFGAFIRIEAIDADTSRLLVDPYGNGEVFQTVVVINHAAQPMDLASLILNGNLVWDDSGMPDRISMTDVNPSGRRVVEVVLSANSDTFVAPGAEDYFIDARSGSDRITGGPGNDQINGGVGSDTIQSGAGDDTLVYGLGPNGFDVVDGGVGFDRIVVAADGVVIGLASITGIEEIYGGDFNNVRIAGSAASDYFDFSSVALIGIASIDAGGGNDTVIGSATDDVIIGGSGNDLLRGNGGNDVFLVGASAGTDTYDGGEGTDRIEASAANVTLTVTGTNIVGVETVSSAGFTGFKLVGTSAANVLDFSGMALLGVALISGGSGNDVIIGSSDADFIEGGVGRDTLTGGTGEDVFVFNSTTHSRGTTSIDRITDFAQGQDRIDLSGIDASTLALGNDAFLFIGTSAFSGVAGQLRFDFASIPGVTRILADVDGNLAADMEIQLTGTIVLNAGDFIL